MGAKKKPSAKFASNALNLSEEDKKLLKILLQKENKLWSLTDIDACTTLFQKALKAEPRPHLQEVLDRVTKENYKMKTEDQIRENRICNLRTLAARFHFLDAQDLVTTPPLPSHEKYLSAQNIEQQLEKLEEIVTRREICRQQVSEVFAKVEGPLAALLALDEQLLGLKQQVIEGRPEFKGGYKEVTDYIEQHLSKLLASGHFSQVDLNKFGLKKIVKALNNKCDRTDGVVSDVIPAGASLTCNKPPEISHSILEYVEPIATKVRLSKTRKLSKNSDVNVSLK